MVCRLASEHIEIRPNGNISICCITNFVITDSDNKPVNISQGLEHALSQTSLQTFRNQLLSNSRPVECNACWSLEQSGMYSKRQMENNRFPSAADTYTSLDLKLGNTCNLKCRICSSYASTRWINDEIKLNGSGGKYTEWALDDNVFNEILKVSNNIKYIEFSGGEPFLIQKQFDFIQKLHELGLSSNLEIQYHTNTTVFPDRYIDLLNNFKQVNIVLSIDNTESQFEYLRYPANWNTCLENIFKFKQTKFKLSISHSINALNVYYLPEFLEWAREIKIPVYNNMVHYPFNFKYLSDRTKYAIKEKHNSMLSIDTSYQINPVTPNDNWIINNMFTEMNHNKNYEFLSAIKAIDNIRGQDYSLNFKDMYNLLAESTA